MLKTVVLFLLIFISQGIHFLFGQNSSTWMDGAKNNAWGERGNWTPEDANLRMFATDIAHFGPIGSGTISLDTIPINPILSSLIFTHPSGLTISSNRGNSIQFKPYGTTFPTLQVAGGNQTISAPILIHNTTLNIEVFSLLTVNEQISATGDGNISFSGPGQMTISSPSGIEIPGTLNQSSGILRNCNQNEMTHSANGSSVFANTRILIDGGTYENINTGNISAGIGSLTSNNSEEGAITINHGMVSVINGDPANPGSGSISGSGIGSLVQSGSDFTIHQGKLNIFNYASLAHDQKFASCTEVYSGGSFRMDQSTLTVANQGHIHSQIGSFGCTLQANEEITITGGAATFKNSGSVIGNNRIHDTIGVYVIPLTDFTANDVTLIFANNGSLTGINAQGVALFPKHNFTINRGTTGLINSESVSGQFSNGVLIQASHDVVLNGGSTFLLNLAAMQGAANSLPSGIIFVGANQLTMDNEAKLNIVNTGATQDTFAIESGANSHFTLNSGTLIAENSGLITNTVNESAGISLAGGTTFTVNGGSINLTNRGRIQATAGSCGIEIISSNFIMNDGVITLSNSSPITGSDCGGILFKTFTNSTINGGTFTLSPNTGFVSGTNVSGSRIEAYGGLNLNGGTLVNNDTVQTPLLNIGTGGHLMGHGLFTDLSAGPTTQIRNSGTVTPGHPALAASNPGVMTITGGYTQSSSGTLVTHLVNSTTYSQLNILGMTPGTAELNGNLQVEVSPDATLLPEELFTIIQTSNGVTGAFSHISSNTPHFEPHIQYLPNSVVLSFTPLSFTPPPPTLNSYVGGFSNVFLSSINQLNVHLGRQMVRLRDRFTTRNPFTPDEVTQLLVSNDLSPPVSSELSNSYEPPLPWHLYRFKMGNTFTNINEATRLPVNNDPAPFESDAEEGWEVPFECKSRLPWNFYLGPTGNFGHVSKTGTQVGFNYWSSGALLGFDYAFSQFGLGLLLDYDHISADAHRWGHFQIDDAHGSLYATYAPERLPQLGFDAIVGGSYEWYDFHRKIETAPQVAVGKPKGGEFDALFAIEYAWTRDRIEFIPMASIQYIYLNVGSYKEKGEELYTFHMNSQTIQSLRSTFGGRLNYSVTKGCYSVRTEIDAAWQREYLNHKRSIAFTPVSSVEPFSTLRAPGSGRNIVLAGIDLLTTYWEKYGWEVSYDFEWNESYLNHNFYLGFNATF